MPKTLRVLLIDDHPIILDSYRNVLKSISDQNPDLNFNVKSATDCDSADYLIEEAVNGIPYDLVFLDIRLPASKTKKIRSGEDLGIKIRELFKDAKILIFTMYTDNYRLNTILKTLNPDAFLIKTDVSTQVLTEAIETIISEPPFYSKTVMRLLRQTVSNDFLLDQIDRTLLYFLSNGSNIKELTDALPLSRTGVVRRKSKLMDVLGIDSNNDTELIQKAHELGIV